MNLRTVAIHQPNFFPWLGYFNKIARVDVFVLLDDVQFPKTGAGTWINRVKWSVNGRAAWMTVPIVRSYHGIRKINEMKIDNGGPWRKKMLKSLETNYGRAPCFAEIMPWLQPLVEFETDDLCRYNLNSLHELVRRLGLDARQIVAASSLPGKGAATQLLISLVKAVQGRAYLCGGGASGYQEDGLFERESILLVQQRFQPSPYPQLGGGAFIPGLSIVDALMNCGVQGTRDLILRDP